MCPRIAAARASFTGSGPRPGSRSVATPSIRTRSARSNVRTRESRSIGRRSLPPGCRRWRLWRTGARSGASSGRSSAPGPPTPLRSKASTSKASTWQSRPRCPTSPHSKPCPVSSLMSSTSMSNQGRKKQWMRSPLASARRNHLCRRRRRPDPSSAGDGAAEGVAAVLRIGRPRPTRAAPRKTDRWIRRPAAEKPSNEE